MTSDELARSYLRKCRDRMAALAVLVERKAHSDVVRESQEVVELALKGMLRSVGIDPPKWHDVGDLLVQYADRFPAVSGSAIAALAEASRRLRREREFSFYGDIDVIPTDAYSEVESAEAYRDAMAAVAAFEGVIPPPPA